MKTGKIKAFYPLKNNSLLFVFLIEYFQETFSLYTATAFIVSSLITDDLRDQGLSRLVLH